MLAAEGSTSPGKGASHGYLDVHKRPESTADAIMLLNRVEGQDGKEEAWDTRSTSPPRVSIDSTPRPATSFQLPTFEDLLFDLLFAAVLNVYSASMSFDRARQIAAFAAFFAILWWAWFTQTLFDVRYRQRTGRLRSVAQGVLRFVLLCVWLGFTTVPSEFTRSGFATATLLYALTRVCLILDFALVWSLDPSLRCDPQMRLGTCVIVAASTISAIMWGVSRLFDDNFGVVWQQGVMWGLAILLEVVAQSYTELTLRFGPLGDTILAERMATFGLIILGEGFNSLGDVLNGFSIGAHQWGGDGSPAGGWGRGSILQTLSSVITLLMQFYGECATLARRDRPHRCFTHQRSLMPPNPMASLLLRRLARARPPSPRWAQLELHAPHPTSGQFGHRRWSEEGCRFPQCYARHRGAFRQPAQMAARLPAVERVRLLRPVRHHRWSKRDHAGARQCQSARSRAVDVHHYRRDSRQSNPQRRAGSWPQKRRKRDGVHIP